MRHGKTLHVSELRLGDVVRLIRGPAPHTMAGDLPDFREGYDAMTVADMDDSFLTFHRPHIEIYGNSHGPNHVTVGVEIVSRVPRDHSGLYYELLSLGQNHPSGSSHWDTQPRMATTSLTPLR